MNSFWRAVYFAMQGILHAVRHERNFRWQLLVFVLAVVAAVVIGVSLEAMAIIVVISSVVLAAELFNTALEALADSVQPEEHPGIRLAKDSAAGAVLVASLGALVVGGLIFIAALLSRLGQI